jgi:hypothetical protein
LFVLNLLAAVVLLVVTLITGKRGIKLLHMRMAVTTVVVLLLAVWQADLFGHGFTFDMLKLKIHLAFAFATLFAIPPVIFSGWRLRNDGRWRQIHLRFVGLFMVCIVLAIATACFMFLDAVPNEATA